MSVAPATDVVFGESVVKPGSLMAMAPSANRVFGLLDDDVPIDSVVSIFRDPVSDARVGVRLSDLWIDVDAAPRQLRLAERAFFALLFSHETPRTIGELRRLVGKRLKNRIVGVDERSEEFFEAAFRKREEPVEE